MESSTTVERVLTSEIDNSDGVYLYLEDNEWCAYERSAYYLASLDVPVKLKREVIRDGYDVVLLKAMLPADNMYLPLSPNTVLKLVADDRLLFRMNKAIGGFPEWKESQLVRLPA